MQQVERALEALSGGHTQELAELHDRLDREVEQRESLYMRVRAAVEPVLRWGEVGDQLQQRLTRCEDSLAKHGTMQDEMWAKVDSVIGRETMHEQRWDRVTNCMKHYESLCDTLSKKVEDAHAHSADLLKYMQEIIGQEVKRVQEGTRGSIAELRIDVERILMGQREAAGERATREEVMREFVASSCEGAIRESSRALATSLQTMQDDTSRKLAANLGGIQARLSDESKVLESSIEGCFQQIADLKEERTITDLDSRIERHLQGALDAGLASTAGGSTLAEVNTAQAGMMEEFARHLADMQGSNADKMEEMHRANDRAFDVLEQNFSDWMQMCETQWSVKESALQELVQEFKGFRDGRDGGPTWGAAR